MDFHRIDGNHEKTNMTPYLPLVPPTLTRPVDWTAELAVYPCYIQPKMNGVRGMIAPDGRVFKRSLDQCHSLKGKFGEPGHWIDGEIWHPEMEFNEIAGLVNRAEMDDEVARLQFWAFDLVHPEMLQVDRLYSLSLVQAKCNNKFDYIITKRVEGWGYARVLYDDIQTNPHYDGIIYRDPNAVYQFGKTQYVLKRKKQFDAEYRCVGVTAGMGKYFGMLGAFQLVTDTGETFGCGGGDLTIADRKAFWKNPPIGEMLQIRFPYKSGNIPQCPQFVRVRKDMAA